MAALRTALPRVLRRPATAAALARPGIAPLVSRRHYSEINPTPIFHLTETEEMLKESVSRFSKEVILPKVREMDEAEMMDRGIVEQLFEQGVMGIEIEEEYGGSGMSFGSAVVAIEELARVDPSVSSIYPPPPLRRRTQLTPAGLRPRRRPQHPRQHRLPNLWLSRS
jgi:short/branched chain acyl-CoA dehydrogenase